MMIGRGILRLTREVEGSQLVQMDGLADETLDDVEHLQDYGHYSRPLDGASGLLMAIAGNRGQAVALAVGDRRYRISLQAGEVAIADDQGQRVHLTRDGIVIETTKALDVTAGEAVTLTAPSVAFDIEGAFAVNCQSFDVTASAASLAADSVTIDGDTVVLQAADALHLGGLGGQPVARKTDPVTSGLISNGSTKVKAT